MDSLPNHVQQKGKHMQSRIAQVLEKFSGGFNCCQSILATYGDIHGIDRKTALKLGCGMGGGLGHAGEVCGFVSAACLLLGLKNGGDTPEAKLKVNPLCLELCDAIVAKYGSVNCKDIIKRDIRTMEATLKAKEEGIFKDICAPCGQFIAELLENKYNILNK
jgi:C_GCAxxG_C_C family probable redox protein